jgi:hypothetical protein
VWIQVVLIAAALIALFSFARFEHGVNIRAGKRLAFFAFIALNIYGVLRPDDVTWAANRLGVGRGADLLLYALAVGTIFLMLNTYLRFRALDRQMTELVRSLALREAERDNAERLGAAAMAGQATVVVRTSDPAAGSDRSVGSMGPPERSELGRTDCSS